MINKTTFKRGEGGRPKGSKNKVTILTKEFLRNFIDHNLETMQRDFDQLDSKDRLYFIEKLLKYILPSEIEHNKIKQVDKFDNWTVEQMEAELERLSGV